MKKRIFIIFLLIFSVNNLRGNDKNAFSTRVNYCIDSLNAQKTDIDKLPVYWKIVHLTSAYDMPLTKKYAFEMLSVAEKQKDIDYIIQAYDYAGIAYCLMCQYDSAIYFYNKIDLLVAKVADNSARERYLMHNRGRMGFLLERQGKYVSALDNFLKLADYRKRQKDYPNLLGCCENIGSINLQLHNYDEAIRFFNEGIDVGEEKDYRVACCHSELAACYLAKNDLQTALRHALWTENEYGGSSGYINDNFNKIILSKIYLKQNNSKKALEYAEKSLIDAQTLNDSTLLVNSCTMLSDVYLQMKNYAAAALEAEKAWKIDTANIDKNRAVTYNLAQAYLHLGNTEKADYFLQKNNDFNKKYSEKSMLAAISDMQTKYKTEEKNMQIAALEKDKKYYARMAVLGLIILLLLIITLIVFLFFWKTKTKIMKKELQLTALRNLLKGENAERKRITQDLHDTLGAMLSAVNLNLNDASQIDTARELLGNAIEEMRRISRRLRPASLEFGLEAALKEFCLALPQVQFQSYGDFSRLSENNNLLLFYCAFELINNALKYSQATEIKVQLMQNGGLVMLAVQDNGVGFDIDSAKLGSGLRNLQSRISSANGTLDITSSADGTEANIEITIDSKP